MGNCVGSKGVKKDPKILTEEEIKVLLDNTNLTRAQIVALHQNFLKECPTGKLTKKDFVKLFKEVHPSENKKEKADKFCEYVFKVIDTNNLGYISFQDFVVCFSLTSYGDFNKKCEFAFKLYDLDRDGIISKKEMTQVLTALYDLSGITDRKGENAPAKKVEEIIRKINAKSQDPEVAAAAAAAAAAEAKKKEKKPKEPKEKKTKEQIKAEKEKQKAEKEAAKREKEQKAKELKEKKAREAEEKKKRAAENKAKGIKEPKPAKEPKPPKPAKAPKPNEYITKEQFIDACNTDETLKKLFVDSIFSQQADQSMLEAKVDDLANRINIELPSLNVKSGDGNRISSTKTIQLNAPKVSVNNGPVSEETKFISTTTTRVTPAENHGQPVTVTTTTRVNPDGTVTTTEESTPVAGNDHANSDSDQTHYSEHTEYVNVNQNESKGINIQLSTDGIKINQSDKDQQQHHQ